MCELTKRLVAIIFTYLLAFGAGFCLSLELDKRQMPGAIWIEHEGETKGYADLAVKTSKIVNITDSSNPGAYLAFPIYAEHGEISKSGIS